MVTPVRDFGSNKNENLIHLAEGLGRSKARQKLFLAIYRGKTPIKTVSELVRATRMTNMRVAQLGGELVAHDLVIKTKVNKELAYQKDSQLVHFKKKILSLAQNPKKRMGLATKQRPHGGGSTTIRVQVGSSFVPPKFVTIDEVDSFALVRKFPNPDPKIRHNRTAESRVKKFLINIIGEKESQGDWGGEKNDLFTTNVRFRGKRCAAAFALKGKATTGPLTPKKLGKNGDQIGRLVSSTATLFFVVYHSKIEESVHEQLRAYASLKAAIGSRLYYGAIDGADLSRLQRAYPKHFK